MGEFLLQTSAINIATQQAPIGTVIFLVVAVILAIALIFYLLKLLKPSKQREFSLKEEEVNPETILKPKYNKEKIRLEREERNLERKRETLFEHLTQEEKQIVEILKLKEGRCEQGTLVVASGLSKAKVSEILSHLEERKIVFKEKKGRKNVVSFLKE